MWRFYLLVAVGVSVDSYEFSFVYSYFIVCVPQKIVITFSMFQDGIKLEHSTRVQNKYYEIKNILNHVKRVSKSGSGWER